MTLLTTPFEADRPAMGIRAIPIAQGNGKDKSRLTAALRKGLVRTGRSGGLLFRFGEGFFAFEVGRAAFPFFHFVVLSAHKINKSLYNADALRLFSEL